MNNELDKVKDWYSKEKSYEYMPEAIKNGLKVWEKEVAAQYLKEQSYILDIGCGMGREAFALYDEGYQVAAVDISESIINQAIQLAAQTKRNIVFNVTNGIDLPFADETFDAVIIWSQTFGLLYGDENKTHMLNECKRVLKSGGILSFSAHDRAYEEQNYPQFLEGNKFWAYKDCYWETFSVSELSTYAENAGLKVLESKEGMIYKPEDGIIIHCECRK